MFNNFTKGKVTSQEKIVQSTSELFNMKFSKNSNNYYIKNSEVVIVSTQLIYDNAMDIKNHVKDILKTDVEISVIFPYVSNDNTLYIFIYLYPNIHAKSYPKNYIVWQIEQLSTTDITERALGKNKIKILQNAIDVYDISMKHYNNNEQYNKNICGSKSHLVTDHKNDLYNDIRVLNSKTQTVDDFQCLCNHCNLQKRQISKQTKIEKKTLWCNKYSTPSSI